MLAQRKVTHVICMTTRKILRETDKMKLLREQQYLDDFPKISLQPSHKLMFIVHLIQNTDY